MGLNLNLFVHGVPKGQKIWGPHEDDRIYIESFYGRKTNVEVQLFVEIIQTSRNVNCYYTYFRSGNIVDTDNRSGSYFALTIRSSEYYTDLVNMYNILDAAYHKFVLGTIIKSDASVTKFIVQDFDHVDKQLQDVEKEIIQYLESFSIGSDFVSLNGFKANAEYDAAIINLLECNSKSLLDYMRSKGNLSVSPLHPTNQIARLTKSKNEEIESIKSQAHQQISKLQNEANQKLKESIEGKEKSIEAIKREYASADKTIIDLKKQLEIEKSSVSTLKNELNENKEKLNNYENIQHELTSKKQELKNVNRILSDVKQSFSAWSEVTTIQEAVQPIATKTVLEKMNKFHPLVDMIVMLILLLVIAYGLLKSPSSNLTSSEELNNAKKQIVQLNKKLKETEKLTKQTTVNAVVPEFSNPSEIIAKYPNAKIDVKELSLTKPNMSMSKTYHISIQNVDVKGIWVSKDFVFNSDNTISPIKTGDNKIDYVVDGVIVKSRTITVVK